MNIRRTRGLRRQAATLAVVGLAAGLLTPAALAAPASAAASAAARHQPSARQQPATVSTRQALAKARATRKPVQISQLTTATSTTTANPDGSLTLDQSLDPQRALHDGKWTPLSADLRRVAGGRLSPALSSAPLSLSAGGSGPLFTMTANLRTLSMSWPTPLPAPAISGPKATYANVLPGVDLVVTAGTTGSVSETIVVQDAAAAANPALASLQFQVAATGLTLSSSPAGNIWASAGPAATPLITAQPPLMWDSAPAPAGLPTATGPGGVEVDAQSGLPATSSITGPGVGAHVAVMGVSVSGSTLTLTPNAADLSGPGIVYPVYLDPTYQNSTPVADASSWTQTDSGFPTTTYWKESGDLQAGYDNWPGNNGLAVARSFIQLPLNSELRGATIGDANIYMDDVWSADGCTAQPVDLYVTKGISSSTNWNTQTAGGFWGKEMEQETFAHGTSGCGSQKGNVSWGTGSAATGGTSAGQLASTLQYDVTQPGGWVTFGLKADSETNDLQWKQFTASASYITMSITFDKPPVAPDDLQVGPGSPGGCQTSEADATLIGADDATFTATVSDPDTKDSLTTEFSIHNASGSVPSGGDITGIKTNGGGGTAPDTLTRAQMEALNTNGQTQAYTYWWEAQSVNQYGTAGPWSEKCWFTYDPTGPGTPDFTYPASAQLGQQFTITVTPPAGCGPAPAQPCPASYTYQLGTAPPAAVGSNDQAIITMNQVGPVNLTVTGYVAGNPSSIPASHQLTGTTPATPLDNGYFAGGSYPSMLTLQAPDSSTPALLLSPGTGNGTLGPAADIGSLGLGTNAGSDGPADWKGNVIAHGDFTGDNVQDVLAFNPATGAGEIVPGTGTAATLTGTPADITGLFSGSLQNANGDNPASPNEQGNSPASQLVGAGNASGLSTGADDLIGIAGDAAGNDYELDLYTNGTAAGTAFPGGYSYAATLSITSPDGNSWGDYSLATVQAGSYPGGTANPGAVTLFALDTTNGNLYQTSTTPMVTTDPSTGLLDPATLAWTQVTTSWGTTPPALVSADIAATGATELWTMSGGKATAYTLSGSTLSKDTTASAVVPAHDWPLTDDQLVTADNDATGGTQSPPTTAADLTGSDQATLSSTGVSWDDQSANPYFSGDIAVNGSSGYLTPPAGTVPSSDTTPVISVWFRTTTPGGVLVSLDSDALTHGTTSSNPFDPVLYIGADGKLYGEWWNGTAGPAVSAGPVDDGAWHHAVLVANGTTQTLYVDNQAGVTVSGTINLTTQGQQLTFGAGYIGGKWPAEPHDGGTATADYFNGTITAITLS